MDLKNQDKKAHPADKYYSNLQYDKNVFEECFEAPPTKLEKAMKWSLR